MYEFINPFAPQECCSFKSQFLLEYYIQRAKNFNSYHISQVDNSSPNTFSVQSRKQWRHQRSSYNKLAGPFVVSSVIALSFGNFVLLPV